MRWAPLALALIVAPGMITSAEDGRTDRTASHALAVAAADLQVASAPDTVPPTRHPPGRLTSPVHVRSMPLDLSRLDASAFGDWDSTRR